MKTLFYRMLFETARYQPQKMVEKVKSDSIWGAGTRKEQSVERGRLFYNKLYRTV